MQPVMQLVVTARVAVWLATAWVVMQLRKHCHMIRAGGGGGCRARWRRQQQRLQWRQREQ